MTDRNPYIAIMIAAQKGVGIRLTPTEVAYLSMDDAISTYAFNCLDPDEQQAIDKAGWKSPLTKRRRKPWSATE